MLATCGDTFLGGDDFDDRLIDLLADEFMQQEGVNLRNDPYALEKLKVAAEEAKKALSIEDRGRDPHPRHLHRARDVRRCSIQRTLSEREFSQLVNDLILRTFKVCDEALQQAGVIARDLDGVILVGGPTRLPMIRDAVRQYFQQEPKTDVDPDQVVAMGAAIHAASLVSSDQEAFLLDVTPLSLRIGVAGGMAETRDRAQHAGADRADPHLHDLPGQPGVACRSGSTRANRAWPTRTSCSASSSSAASGRRGAARSRST